MRTPPSTRRLLAAGLLLPLAAASGCIVRVDSDGYRTREERRFRVSGVPDVRLATFDGAIVVRGWDRDEVYVEVEKRGRDRAEAEAIEVVAQQKGREISVEAREPSTRDYKWGIVHTVARGTRIVATVPEGSDIVLRTGDGAITIERVRGKLELRTRDGAVNGLDIGGDVFAHTEDGSIRLENVDGRCDAATDDGSIHLAGRLEAVQARSGDGALMVKVLPGSRLADDWQLSTGDGAVVLFVPDGLGAELDAESHDGPARFDKALAFAAPDELPRGILRGRLGGGGPGIRHPTGGGSNKNQSEAAPRRPASAPEPLDGRGKIAGAIPSRARRPANPTSDSACRFARPSFDYPAKGVERCDTCC
jgi:hypothetical protein